MKFWMWTGLVVISMVTWAQAQWEATIRLDNFAVGDGKYSFDVIAKAEAGSVYRLGISDLILDVDTSVLENPVLTYAAAEINGTHDAHEGGAVYDDYRPLKIFMLGNVKIDVQIYFEGANTGVGAVLPTSDYRICRVQMDIKNSGKSPALAWDANAGRLSHSVVTAMVANNWLVISGSPLTSAAPVAPQSPGIGTVTDTSIQIQWTDASSTEKGFLIERSLDGLTGWSEIGKVAADVEEFLDQGSLQAKTKYFYRVCSYTTDTNAAPVISATTEAANKVPVITSASADTLEVDASYTYTPTATDATTPVISVEDLPSWLSFDGTDVSGTAPSSPGTETFSVIASDGFLSDTLEVQLVIKSHPVGLRAVSQKQKLLAAPQRTWNAHGAVLPERRAPVWSVSKDSQE